MRRNTVETDECGEPASKSERVLLVVTFKKKKKNQNKPCGCLRERGRRGGLRKGGGVWVDRGRGRGNRGGETEVREREKERAEGGVKGGRKGGRGGGFCPGDAREEELDIHQGEDFST